MAKHQQYRINFTYITIFLYAFYALKTAWLAFDRLQYSPTFYYIGEILVILCLPFAFLTLTFKGNNIPHNRYLLFLPFVNWLYVLCHSYGNTDMLRETFALIIVFAFILFTPEVKTEIFNIFYWLILITGIISVLLYLCYIMKINLGFETVSYYSGRQNEYYIKWFIFAIYKRKTELRLCGIFNEPGGFGTICSLLLVARYNYSKLWEKIVCIVTILFTFSLAGYLIAFIYLAGNMIKKDKRYIIFSLLFVILFLAVPHIDFGNASINRLAARFAITENGFAGDNRVTEAFAYKYNEFIHSPNRWFGFGAGYKLMERGNLSYKTYVVEYGIIGFMFWVLMWIKAGLNHAGKNKECIFFLFFFMMSLYQRPALLESIYGYVLLFGGIEWIQSQNEKCNMKV